MPSHPFKIIGHRGACGHAPENTLRSFQKAIDLGVAWVEFDVQFSADGVPMVIHDATLTRTTRLRGRVRNTQSVALRDPCGKQGDAVPTLSEVLSLLDRHGIGAYVELKSCPEPSLPRLLEQIGVGRADRILSSFKHEWLRQALTLSDRVQLQPLFSRVPLRKPVWLDALHPREVGVGFSSLSNSAARKILHWGYPVVSYTVNEAADIERAMQLGLAGVFTDFPDRVSIVG